jgi:hypothetical protein
MDWGRVICMSSGVTFAFVRLHVNCLCRRANDGMFPGGRGGAQRASCSWTCGVRQGSNAMDASQGGSE